MKHKLVFVCLLICFSFKGFAAVKKTSAKKNTLVEAFVHQPCNGCDSLKSWMAKVQKKPEYLKSLFVVVYHENLQGRSKNQDPLGKLVFTGLHKKRAEANRLGAITIPQVFVNGKSKLSFVKPKKSDEEAQQEVLTEETETAGVLEVELKRENEELILNVEFKSETIFNGRPEIRLVLVADSIKLKNSTEAQQLVALYQQVESLSSVSGKYSAKIRLNSAFTEMDLKSKQLLIVIEEPQQQNPLQSLMIRL